MVQKTWYFMVTIKRNAVDYTSAHEIISKYNEVVKKTKRADWCADAWLETDRMKRIHLHTWVKTHKKPNYREFTSAGWTIHFDQFSSDDLINVMTYCGKDNISINDEEAVEWIDTHSFCFWTLVGSQLMKIHYKFNKTDDTISVQGVTPFLNTEQSEVC